MKWTLSLVLLPGIVFVLVPGALAEDPKNLNEAGVTVILSDAVILSQGVANSDYWEPFTDIFGDGTIAVVAGVHGIDNSNAIISPSMNAKVAFLRPGSTTFEEYWAFYDDAGNPYTGNFNTKRQTGNPPRIACDRRDTGVLRYCVGQEATPWEFAEFTPDRWLDPFFFNERQAACQLFELTTNGPQPITDVFDSIYGGIEGSQNSGHMRWGGDMVFLSNGNLLACPEDRTSFTVAGTAAVAAIYDGATGARITQPFVANGNGTAKEIWSNVAAFEGGFLVRNSGVLTSFDNEANVIKTFNQPEVSAVADQGRSDDARICGSINDHHIYLAGSDGAGSVVLSKIDALTGTKVKEVYVTEEFYFDVAQNYATVDCAVDDNGNVVVSWSTQFIGVTQPDATARIFDSNLDPATPSFFVFSSHNSDLEGDIGYRSAEGNCSMDNERIVISMNGIIDDPVTGEYTPAESTLVTVLANPFYVAVDEWELY